MKWLGSTMTVRRRVALHGRVTTAPTGALVSSATVRLVDMPEPAQVRVDTLTGARLEGARGWPDPDRTRTAADGSFFFLDLPAGSYELVAESTRPDRSSTPVSVKLEEPPDGDRSGRPIPHVELQLREPRNRS